MCLYICKIKEVRLDYIIEINVDLVDVLIGGLYY